MENLLVRKLGRFSQLSPDECEALDRIASQRVYRCRQREDVIREGDRPTYVNLILQGWAYRYKILADGRRQILSYFVPGDLCDLHIYLLDRMDHSIAALTPLVYARITREDFERLTNGRPQLMQALHWDSLVSAAIQREWTTDIGQRSALERIAHLLLELFHRLDAVGLADGLQCDLPLTQAEIAEAMGITPIHANRMLQELRTSNLIAFARKRLHILDMAGLKAVAQFNENYLHLQRARHRFATST